MANHIKQKTEQIRKVHDILKNAKLSKDDYNSSDQPFFMQEHTEDFKIGHITIPELPEGLNRNFKTFYEFVGNPKKEVYIGQWTIMSLDEAMKRYNDLCDKDQKTVFDIGYRYLGMGHIEVLSCNLYNHLLFFRRDGGSSGFDREYNYKQLINFDFRKYEYFYFNHMKW